MMNDNNSDEILTDGECSIVEEDTGRIHRSKRKLLEPTTCCPVCSLTVRPTEMSTHLTSEVEKLDKLSCPKQKVNCNPKNGIPSSPTISPHPSNTNLRNKHWETYQKVKSNRTVRQRVKSRKRRVEGVICPICNSETTDDIQLHVEVCLRRSEDTPEDPIDVVAYEEYEWAGQSRVRATSLLEGGVVSIGTPISMADEDEDLVVDGDDAHVYGSPQYSERDIIVPSFDREQEALRKAVTGFDNSQESSCDPHVIVEGEISMNVKGDPIVNALKSRIRELEAREQFKDEVYKCLICMERYKTPVISVCCWHVHCEKCWLQTLGAKKLCPQCNMITSPADLRRIYM